VRAAALRAGLVLVVVVTLDQLTKAAVVGALAPGERRDLLLGIDLVHVRNTGVAFSLLAGSGVLVVALVVLALAVLVTYAVRHAGEPLVWLPTGLLLGGAIGNLADRVRGEGVVDFVKLPHWPAFNVADSAITVGVVALFVLAEVNARRERRAAASRG
jgi:signal peptidase II